MEVKPPPIDTSHLKVIGKVSGSGSLVVLQKQVEVAAMDHKGRSRDSWTDKGTCKHSSMTWVVHDRSSVERLDAKEETCSFTEVLRSPGSQLIHFSIIPYQVGIMMDESRHDFREPKAAIIHALSGRHRVFGMVDAGIFRFLFKFIVHPSSAGVGMLRGTEEIKDAVLFFTNCQLLLLGKEVYSPLG